jgi:WD40 repeat protein
VLVIGWKSGEIDYLLLEYDSIKQINQMKPTGHDKRILDYSIDHVNDILATSSKDKKIKFWDINKNLLKELQFTE